MGAERAPLRFRRFWTACGAAFVALVVYLSLAPSAPDLGNVESVKLGHVVAYLWLMFWFGQLSPSRARQAAAAAALAGLGIVLEYLQGMTPHRSFAYVDMVANTIGVALGWLLAQTPAATLLARIERRVP